MILCNRGWLPETRRVVRRTWRWRWRLGKGGRFAALRIGSDEKRQLRGRRTDSTRVGQVGPENDVNLGTSAASSFCLRSLARGCSSCIPSHRTRSGSVEAHAETSRRTPPNFQRSHAGSLSGPWFPVSFILGPTPVHSLVWVRTHSASRPSTFRGPRWHTHPLPSSLPSRSLPPCREASKCASPSLPALLASSMECVIYTYHLATTPCMVRSARVASL